MGQVLRRFVLIGISFLIGLVVFYVPERSYRSLEEIWLSPAVATKKIDTLSLPVRSWLAADGVMRFGPEYPGGPQIAEADIKTAPACKDMFHKEGLITQSCQSLGDTRVAIGGMASSKDAATYLGTFTKVARRNVSSVLAQNRRHASEVLTALRDQRDAQSLMSAQAYLHVPFTPVMPATLPANWSQHLIKISGKDVLHPTQVDIFYNKGRERTVVVTTVSSSAFRMDTLCGPTPSALGDQYVPCSKVPNEEYFVGGQSNGQTADWYAYRRMGDSVAIVQVSAFARNNFPPVLLNRDLEVQAAIIKSLHAVDRTRLKDAIFSGPSQPTYTGLGL
jgi:hypothetical protein